MGIDLAQFHQAFFDESFEALGSMESALLNLDAGAPDPEAINTIFRVAHSVKGGAGMFGFTEIASFTHSLETVLDELRERRLTMTEGVSDILLRSVDVLRGLLNAAQHQGSFDPQKAADVQFDLEALVAGKADPTAGAGPPSPGRSAENLETWKIEFKPAADLFTRGQDPGAIFESLAELGELQASAEVETLPALAEMDPTRCYLTWVLRLRTASEQSRIEEVFSWVDDGSEVSVTRELAGQGAPESRSESIEQDLQVPPGGASVVSLADARKAESEEKSEAMRRDARVSPDARSSGNGASAGGDSSSIRVSVEKIDELINTVGEIVITQSMLAQLGLQAEGPAAERLRMGLAQLERNVRELHESVMRVRMLPIGFAFSRFPRLVRDLAHRLGKQIDLRMTGEQTELDKTVLERIGDPLVHLVRNSIDHGIEMPEVRAAAGKTPAGTVHLAAFHRGSAIIIEVSDDGAGLDSEKILAKARGRGLIGPNEAPSEEATYDLIFLPGFSTAERTTDISGRGVGMDVVRKNVKALGGQIELKSERGRGSKFIITLPLTLAIVDGQSVCVGSETYILPLVSIIESLQVKAGSIRRLSTGAEVFAFRGDYLPIIRLHEVFGVEPRSRALHEGLVVVAEGDGQRVGLFVDDLRGQQQVVIKSLETNYGHVPGVSGATILGDGSVALILDLSGLIRFASGRAAA